MRLGECSKILSKTNHWNISDHISLAFDVRNPSMIRYSWFFISWKSSGKGPAIYLSTWTLPAPSQSGSTHSMCILKVFWVTRLSLKSDYAVLKLILDALRLLLGLAQSTRSHSVYNFTGAYLHELYAWIYVHVHVYIYIYTHKHIHRNRYVYALTCFIDSFMPSAP